MAVQFLSLMSSDGYDSLDSSRGQELEIGLVASLPYHLLLKSFKVSSCGGRPNKISHCTRMRTARFWNDDPILLGISVATANSCPNFYTHIN